jgi:hypothetical protein
VLRDSLCAKVVSPGRTARNRSDRSHVKMKSISPGKQSDGLDQCQLQRSVGRVLHGQLHRHRVHDHRAERRDHRLHQGHNAQRDADQQRQVPRAPRSAGPKGGICTSSFRDLPGPSAARGDSARKVPFLESAADQNQILSKDLTLTWPRSL